MDKKCLIITGGKIDYDFAIEYIGQNEFDRVIAADSGIEFCRRANRIPDLILGDFDSANPQTLAFFQEKCPDRIETFPARKDATDSELAFLRAAEWGALQITILGGTGTRMDHVMGNIHLPKQALDAGIACELVDAHNRIRLIDQPLILNKSDQFGEQVSLIPFTPQVEGLTLCGFAYPLDHFTLTWGTSRGISNVIESDRASIQFSSGILLVMETKD